MTTITTILETYGSNPIEVAALVLKAENFYFVFVFLELVYLPTKNTN